MVGHGQLPHHLCPYHYCFIPLPTPHLHHPVHHNIAPCAVGNKEVVEDIEGEDGTGGRPTMDYGPVVQRHRPRVEPDLLVVGREFPTRCDDVVHPPSNTTPASEALFLGLVAEETPVALPTAVVRESCREGRGCGLV